MYVEGKLLSQLVFVFRVAHVGKGSLSFVRFLDVEGVKFQLIVRT